MFGRLMAMANSKKKPNRKTVLLGLGLDNQDGHTRVTNGENFQLIGGSAETHGSMQEKAIKMNEHLQQRGKSLDNVSREEFHEIADKIGMKFIPPRHRLPKPE